MQPLRRTTLLPQVAPTICPKDGGPLYVRYDLSAMHGKASRDAVGRGPKSMWRYAAVMPDAEPVTLGEGFTPHAAQPQISQPPD